MILNFDLIYHSLINIAVSHLQYFADLKCKTRRVDRSSVYLHLKVRMWLRMFLSSKSLYSLIDLLD